MKQQLLIVDDNDMMRSFLSHYFSKHYDVQTANNGQTAWSVLDGGFFPDLVLLDLNMPEYDGLALLKQLKNSVLFHDIPVIVLSSVSKSQEKIKCLHAGAVDYITKPFNPQELEARLQYHLRVNNVKA
ncbi:MAG: response regulator transcription factor [Saprospiraceae bacterium]